MERLIPVTSVTYAARHMGHFGIRTKTTDGPINLAARIQHCKNVWSLSVFGVLSALVLQHFVSMIKAPPHNNHFSFREHNDLWHQQSHRRRIYRDALPNG